MKHVDFLKLDNAINGLIIEETALLIEYVPLKQTKIVFNLREVLD